jgi:hypothetical protein
MSICSYRDFTIGAAAALAAISLSPGSAHAIVVMPCDPSCSTPLTTYRVRGYDLITFRGSYNNNQKQNSTLAKKQIGQNVKI